MYVGLIATRYATALDEFASANGEERRTYEEVLRLMAYYQADFDLRALFFSPVLPEQEKIDLLQRMLDGPMCASLEGFLRLVIRRHREHYVFFMFNSFAALYKKRHNIRDAELITAAPVDEGTVERFRRIARTDKRSEVNLRCEVRPELIGGFIFQMDDLRVDASLSSQFDRLKQKFCGKPNRIV